MNLLPGVSLLRLGIYAAVVAGLFGAGVYFEHGRMQKKLDAEVARHNQFVGGVAALGHQAAAENAKRALADITRKERTDAEHDRRTRAAGVTIRRLRATAAARDSRGGSVSAAPAGSGCPEGQVCFDRAEYQRALGAFDRGTRQLADEGTQVTLDLNAAIGWANP